MALWRIDTEAGTRAYCLAESLPEAIGKWKEWCKSGFGIAGIQRIAEDCELIDIPQKPVGNLLSIEEARARHVCRVCRINNRSYPPANPFVLNHGKEYAHKLCLDSCGLPTEPNCE